MERGRADIIALSLFLGVLAFIGVSFLIAGIELHANAVRTTATVVSVRRIHDSGRAGGYHVEFTLQFTDLRGGRHTERTEEIRNDPAPGDHVDIYYASDDPANLADVRFGSPGRHDFFMAATFGCAVIAAPIAACLIHVIKKSIRARRRRKLIAWPVADDPGVRRRGSR